jgi:hypothetical protein
MAPNEILEALRIRPFEPFRVCLTDGKYYEICHPEACMPTKRVVFIGLGSDRQNPLPDHAVTVDPLHIIRLEPVPATPKK